MIELITVVVGVGCLFLGAISGVVVMALCISGKNADTASEKALLYKRQQELKTGTKHPFD